MKFLAYQDVYAMASLRAPGRCPGLGEPRAFGPAEEQKPHPSRWRVFTIPGSSNPEPLSNA